MEAHSTHVVLKPIRGLKIKKWFIRGLFYDADPGYTEFRWRNVVNSFAFLLFRNIDLAQVFEMPSRKRQGIVYSA